MITTPAPRKDGERTRNPEPSLKQNAAQGMRGKPHKPYAALIAWKAISASQPFRPFDGRRK